MLKKNEGPKPKAPTGHGGELIWELECYPTVSSYSYKSSWSCAGPSAVSELSSLAVMPIPTLGATTESQIPTVLAWSIGDKWQDGEP